MKTCTAVVVTALSVAGLTACSSDTGSTDTGSTAAAGLSDTAAPRISHGAAPECPALPTFDTPPEKVVTLDTAAAAVLVELGVGDRIVGTAGDDYTADFRDSAQFPDLYDTLAGLPDLDKEGRGNKEKVIAAQPQLVTGISAYALGSFAGTASESELADNGIHGYVACPDESGPVTDFSATDDYIRGLGAIFDVPDKADALIDRLHDSLPDTGTSGVPVLVLASVPEGGQDIRTRGAGTTANAVVTVAGGRNIGADAPGSMTSFSAEAVAEKNPEVIVVATGLSPQSPDEMVDAVTSSPLLQSTGAVRNGRVIAVPQTEMLSPGLLNSEAAARIADAVGEVK
jgi:iron complex transport system substrate-binding protein